VIESQTYSFRQRWLVIAAALGVAAFGAWNFTRLPIDAVPDITNVQVQINIVAGGYSPLEVEQRITFLSASTRLCSSGPIPSSELIKPS
jgi:Cu/Ag efflux pump CusA